MAKQPPKQAEAEPAKATNATLKRRITPDQVRQTLHNTSGNLSAAAAKLGVNRSSLYRYIYRNPEMQHVLDDVVESKLDSRTDLAPVSIQPILHHSLAKVLACATGGDGAA